MNKLRVFGDSLALCVEFTELLKELLAAYPTVNVALSGGSTPQVLFDYWSEHQATAIPWERVVFFWGDERCVPPNDAMSNYGMTHRHLFSRVGAIPAENIYRILGENEPQDEAERYGRLLDEKLPVHNDLPCFELVILGMGEDGHTASIFPDQIDLWDSPTQCVVAKHPETHQKRVSLTGRVINNARNVAFLVTGKGKAPKVHDIFAKNERSLTYPAARVQPIDGNLYWFMDQAAAAELP